jgi:hypothetical protein
MMRKSYETRLFTFAVPAVSHLNRVNLYLHLDNTNAR